MVATEEANQTKGRNTKPNLSNCQLRGIYQDLTSKALKDEPTVSNLSNRKLPEFEVMLLPKGLKYTSTSHENNPKLKSHIKIYTTSVLLSFSPVITLSGKIVVHVFSHTGCVKNIVRSMKSRM